MMERNNTEATTSSVDGSKNTPKKEEENLMNQKQQQSGPGKKKRRDDVSSSCSWSCSSCPTSALLGEVTNLCCYLMTIVAIVLFGACIALGNYHVHVYPLLTVSTLCCMLYTHTTNNNNSTRQKQHQQQQQHQHLRRTRLITTLISRVHDSICTSTRYNFLTTNANESSNKEDPKSRSTTRLAIWCQKRNRGKRGDPNMNRVNIIFILIPCLYFIINSIIHRVLKKNEEFDIHNAKTHGHLANAFGKMSAFAMSAFLIPISKHSIILKTVHIDPRYGLRVHVFSGYLAIAAGLIHGIYWILIWILLKKDGLWDVFPTRECWDWDELLHGRRRIRILHGDGDHDNDDDNCHRRFVNLLGIICGMFFIGLCGTSLWWVRRNHYRVFYYCHIIFSILLLYGLAMHYNKMILYLAPSILYYLASSMPTWVQALKSRMQGGTRLMQVTHIPDSRGCVELTFPFYNMEEETMEQLLDSDDMDVNEALCGKYIRLHAPEISRVWHPFTVYNTTSTYSDDDGAKSNSNARPNTLSLTFRCTGPFTQQLADRLHTSKTSDTTVNIPYPKIILDGFHGADDQLSKASHHDTVLIIAGGVGIVSYISLINILLKTITATKTATDIDTDTATSDDRNKNMSTSSMEHNDFSNNNNIRTKEIILHWICRDEGLIRYFTHKFLSSCLKKIGNENIPFRVFIHHTNPTYSVTESTHTLPLESSNKSEDLNCDIRQNDNDQSAENMSPGQHGKSFVPFQFAGGCKTWAKNIPAAFVFSLISWGGWWLICYFYGNIQQKHVILTRSFTITAVISYTILSSILCLAIFECLPRVLRSIFNDETGDRIFASATRNKHSSLNEASMADSHPFMVETCCTDNLGLCPEAQMEQNTIHHCRGRPVFLELTEDIFQSAGDTGVFVCGPSSLLKTIRGCCKDVSCALYEEIFEM